VLRHDVAHALVAERHGLGGLLDGEDVAVAERGGLDLDEELIGAGSRNGDCVDDDFALGLGEVSVRNLQYSPCNMPRCVSELHEMMFEHTGSHWPAFMVLGISCVTEPIMTCSYYVSCG
jgi:hypothetical protein